MVAQNADNQRHKLDSIEITGRPSFSHRDLDYKMKMLQLTLVYRRSVVEDRLPSIDQPNRHSIAQETFAKVKPFAIGQPFHRPKILAVEPKLKQNIDQKPSKPLVSITSATLPSNPQHSKVQRLVQMFETGTNTTAKIHSRSLLKQPIKQQATIELKTPQQSPPKNNATVLKKEESAPNDDEIRANLKQRKKLDSS
ncbi:uncharacterized protein LOC135716543 [Ochlerotatus camptorhynchus]|uniref:uncharacterized protein LOC135714207 n=1 Tax=Ochlerotatus camptorhynchus TaxID=644619 RepID=UPI0031DDB1C2